MSLRMRVLHIGYFKKWKEKQFCEQRAGREKKFNLNSVIAYILLYCSQINWFLKIKVVSRINLFISKLYWNIDYMNHWWIFMGRVLS